MPNHYITTALDREDARELFRQIRSKYMFSEYGTGCDRIELPTLRPNIVSGYNCLIRYWEYGSNSKTFAYTYSGSIGSKHELVDDVNTCLVRIPAHIIAENEEQLDTYDYYLLLSTASHYADITLAEEVKYNTTINYYDNAGNFTNSINQGESAWSTSSYDAVLLDSDYQNRLNSHIHFTAAALESITTIRNAGTYYAQYVPSVGLGGNFINNGLISYEGAGTTSLFLYEQFPYPVFDYLDTASIIQYLNTGDDSGQIDPFDIINPTINKITDFKTDFDMWISKNKVTITSSNAQYYENRSTLTGLYKLIVSVTGVDREPSYSQIPTVTINPINNVDQYIDMSFLGDLELTPPESSGYFKVYLTPNSKKQCGFTVGNVYYADNYPDKAYAVDIVRTVVGETYVYEASNGEKLTIHFSEITLDDLKDLVDDGYINREDENDDETGSDILGQFGSGYGTYHINDGAFEDINTAMWSTDWSTLFKPTTTSPTQCIISCKRIPFTIDGQSVGNIPIANLDVQITGTASKVNQVKSFTLPNLQIPAIYGNFVDQYMSKVRVYLPYIGWQELPADAVISKVGRASVGLQSETKTLGFKYIVDFVDGNCKCVISVNGTERWMFEGNCGCDVPITSDNHSAALTRSAKNMTASVMSAAAGAITTASGNVFMGVAGIAGGALSALNSLPTYSYTASANISGLIEASSNHHLMVVVEYPNAWYPNGTAHKVGLPCELYLSLAQCSGFTKCADVDVSGIDCTSDEADMIRSLLTEGVYL